VATIARGAFAAGDHPARWDGNDDAGRRVPTGVYFARLATEAGVATGKIVVSR
jgi:flagellar hook assembly protein FlgD